MSKTKSGFTIAELSIAIGFIAILLIAVGTITVQITTMTQKGIALGAVNDSGAELIDEITRSVNASSYRDFYESDNSSNRFGKIYHQFVKDDKPYYGAFCTGYHTYIWNTGYALQLTDAFDVDNYQATYLPQDDTGEPITDFHLLRVDDPLREVCAKYYDNSVSKKNQYQGGSNPVELLSKTQTGLTLYDFEVYQPAYDTGNRHALYSMSFILGTLSGQVDINASSDYCKSIEGDIYIDFAYCSVNKFNFVARATGGDKTYD